MTAEVPVWVFGRCRWVSGVCRRTTCQDVLEAVLAAPAAPAGEKTTEPPPEPGAALLDPAAYVIVERWKGVERRLDGRVRILKVWAAWGEAQSDVQLQVRRVSEKGAGRSGSVAGHRRHRRAKQQQQRPGRPGPTVQQHDQEEVHRLMRLILAQGETIAGQLRRLREREAQIERLEVEAHREREARHGKDYVLAAYLDKQDGPEDQQDTPRTSRQPGRPGGPGGIRPRQLVEEDAAHFADESEAEQAGPAGPAGQQAGQPAGEDERAVEQDELRAHIALWEKVVRVNKRLEQQEERLVRLYVGFRRSAPDGLAVDDREQLRASLARLQQDVEDGRRDLEANAQLLTETEALLEAKRRLLRRLLAELEAADADTERLLAAQQRESTTAAPAPPPAPPPPVTTTLTPCNRHVVKGHDNDSNSDTGLSSLHSSSEEGVYILDTLV